MQDLHSLRWYRGNLPRHRQQHRWNRVWRCTCEMGRRLGYAVRDQFMELMDTIFCSSKSTTLNGIHGQIFTSKKNGQSIFMPESGYCFPSFFFQIIVFDDKKNLRRPLLVFIITPKRHRICQTPPVVYRHAFFAQWFQPNKRLQHSPSFQIGSPPPALRRLHISLHYYLKLHSNEYTKKCRKYLFSSKLG